MISNLSKQMLQLDHMVPPKDLMKRGRKESCVIIGASVHSLELLKTSVWCFLTGLSFMVKCVCTYACVWDLETDPECWLNDPRSVYRLGQQGWRGVSSTLRRTPSLLPSPSQSSHGVCYPLGAWLFRPPPPPPLPFFSPLVPPSSPPSSVPGHLVRGSLLCGTAADYVIISGPFWSPSVCVWVWD